MRKHVAYFGMPGSFSHMAADAYFQNEKVDMTSHASLMSLFKSIAGGGSRFGVVPLENSTTGSIAQTYDGILSSRLSLTGEVLLHIHHHLLGKTKGKKAREITACYSHPAAISQCDQFLKSHPGMTPKFTSDTASAAKEVGEAKSDTVAAIASRLASHLYHLTIMKESIEDNKNNFTRFGIIEKLGGTNGDKMSITFSLRHIPGNLSRALKPFAEKGFNLTKIESRPVFGKMWEYIFFLDFEVGRQKKELQEALRELKEVTNFVTLLGFYKKGNTYET